jgi:RNA binding exosome subunit
MTNEKKLYQSILTKIISYVTITRSSRLLDHINLASDNSGSFYLLLLKRELYKVDHLESLVGLLI